MMPLSLRLASRFRALIAGASLLAPSAFAQTVKWDAIPTMELERLYRGPLRDTVVQRWRDPVDGTLCYLYIPITAPHSPPTESGYVQYGPNIIGSISCVPSTGKPPATQVKGPAAESAAQPASAKPGARPSPKPAASRARPAATEKPPPALAPPPSDALPEPKPSAAE